MRWLRDLFAFSTNDGLDLSRPCLANGMGVAASLRRCGSLWRLKPGEVVPPWLIVGLNWAGGAATVANDGSDFIGERGYHIWMGGGQVVALLWILTKVIEFKARLAVAPNTPRLSSVLQL